MEDNRKALFETQYYKDRLDKLKYEMHELKKAYKDAAQYKALYEELKLREEERGKTEIKQRTIEEIKRQVERHSLLGHLKQLKINNSVRQK